MGELFGKHVQAYPRYGSEKKGLPTSYSLTMADEPDPRPRRAATRSTSCSLHDVSGFAPGRPLAGLVDGGTVFVQSALTDPAAIWSSIPTRREPRWRARRIRRHRARHGRARPRSPRARISCSDMQGVALVGVFLRMTAVRSRAGLGR